jgi:hypothetical protein
MVYNLNLQGYFFSSAGYSTEVIAQRYEIRRLLQSQKENWRDFYKQEAPMELLLAQTLPTSEVTCSRGASCL